MRSHLNVAQKNSSTNVHGYYYYYIAEDNQQNSLTKRWTYTHTFSWIEKIVHREKVSLFMGE